MRRAQSLTTLVPVRGVELPTFASPRGGLISRKSDDEVELFKLRFSTLLSGALEVIFDNVVKVFQSSIWCSAIMPGTITARVLGVSQDRTAHARLMRLVSGNGVSMDRDEA